MRARLSEMSAAEAGDPRDHCPESKACEVEEINQPDQNSAGQLVETQNPRLENGPFRPFLIAKSGIHATGWAPLRQAAAACASQAQTWPKPGPNLALGLRRTCTGIASPDRGRRPPPVSFWKSR